MTQKTLQDKVAIISGASRGIGAQTALTLAKHGCHVVITGKTSEPHPTLDGTIHTVAKQCQEFGVQALAIQCDVRNEDDINKVTMETAKKFGKIDILINSASAIYLHDTTKVTSKEFDLMHDINVRGTYLMSKSAASFLKLSDNGHIVNFAPPLALNAGYFHKHTAYTMSKYAMSMCTLGMSHEFYHDNIAVNSLWPRTVIKTAATDRLINNTKISDKYMRKATIMADAVMHIVTKPAKVCTGCFLIDDLVLMGAGVTDFDQYAHEGSTVLLQDLFLPHDLPPPPEGITLKQWR
ncbi:MAG: citronellol/citronellal dehydrogenase [Alphaproteobacteria bacterium]|jgi:citronellol/citronellal dehydrogenase